MSDLPRDPADGGEDDPFDPIDPPEPELDEDGNPVDPEPELDEDGNPVEPEPEPEPEPRQTRRPGPRGRANGEEIRELRSQLERTNQQLDELRRRPAPQQFDPAADARARAELAERRAMMSPAELAQDIEQGLTQQFLRVRAQDQMAIEERLDRQAYDTAARSSRVHQQYRQRVEDLVEKERSRGNVVSRQIALENLVGRDSIDRANRVVPGQRRAAGARVAAQTTRPTTGRGDVARGGSRRNPDADDEALLRNITAGDI